MSVILSEIWKSVDALMQLSDPRVQNFPLMGSPFLIITLLVSYNYFVRKFIPKFMANRKPFELKNVMIVYNMVQILMNGYFVEESLRLIWIPMRYSVLCEEVDYSNHPDALKVAFFVYLYLLTKILDLLDTVFMVLRKRHNQVTFLHVYHHTAMVVAGWLATKFVAGGHCIFFGTINAFVHTIMYTYYLLTILYPQYKKSIWWKKHLTELQLVQFVVTSLHGTAALLNPNCGFPKVLLALFIPQDVFMFFLFLDFYKKAYRNKKPKQDDQSDKMKSNGSAHADTNSHLTKKHR